MSTAYCFDLDGTLTRQELLPLIAAATDMSDEISALTEATIHGLILFEKSFKLRVRLLRDVSFSAIHDVFETQVDFDPDIMAFIQSRPEQCFVVTGNLDVWVKPMLDKLGIASFTSIAKLGQGGALEGVQAILNKGDAIAGLKERFHRIVAIGEGMNDVPMFEVADVRVAFGGAHEPSRVLKQVSDFVVNDGRALCRLLNML
ncbi:MAG: HAD family phosphatase [Moraxellaceae bacterium]|nr:HAD family phosphatase [Moraxellaceae bacterium]